MGFIPSYSLMDRCFTPFLISAMATLFGCQKIEIDSSYHFSHVKETLIADKDVIVFPELRERQSMVFYQDKAIFVLGQSCEIYDLRSFSRKASLTLPCDGYAVPHSNSLCLGPNKYSKGSLFPAMYVSSWSNGRQAFVYDIFEKGESSHASLVQVIDPGLVNEDIIGLGYLDWVVDGENGFLYSLAYHLEDT